jgi:hypothetical protein
MVVVALQILVLFTVGGSLVAASDDPSSLPASLRIGQSSLATVGWVVVAFGLLQVILVVLLGRGSEMARSWFGLLAVVQAAGGVYSTVALRDFQPAVLAPLAVSIAVLWLLYGSQETREYFDA